MPTGMHAGATVLAHQGGWDEVVLVLLPLIVLAGLLRLARRRAVREAENETATPGMTSVEAPGAGPE